MATRIIEALWGELHRFRAQDITHLDLAVRGQTSQIDIIGILTYRTRGWVTGGEEWAAGDTLIVAVDGPVGFEGEGNHICIPRRATLVVEQIPDATRTEWPTFDPFSMIQAMTWMEWENYADYSINGNVQDVAAGRADQIGIPSTNTPGVGVTLPADIARFGAPRVAAGVDPRPTMFCQLSRTWYDADAAGGPTNGRLAASVEYYMIPANAQFSDYYLVNWLDRLVPETQFWT